MGVDLAGGRGPQSRQGHGGNRELVGVHSEAHPCTHVLSVLPTKDERRVFGNFSTRTPELYAPIRKLGNLSCELSENSTLLEACKYYRWDEFDPRTPMLPPWPERAQFAQLKQAWSRLPIGSLTATSGIGIAGTSRTCTSLCPQRESSAVFRRLESWKGAT